MNVVTEQEKALVTIAETALGSLPQDGRMNFYRAALMKMPDADRAALLAMLPEVPASEKLPSFATRIDDSTFAFKVEGNPNQTQEEHINAKLGGDAQVLIDDLQSIGVKVHKIKVPAHSEAILSWASSNKTYARQKKFYPNGLANPYMAINIAMEVVCAAKKAGIDLRFINNEESWKASGARVEREALAKGFDEGTVAALRMLQGGVIRFNNGPSSGALYIKNDGCLHACNGSGNGSEPGHCAFGARSSAE